MKALPKIPERRCNKRFPVTGNTLAVLRPAPSRPGKLLRIREDAAEFIHCQADGSCDMATDELDILVPDFTRGIFLEKVRVKTVSDLPAATSAAGEHGYDRMRKRVVRFENLTADQVGQLQSFIYSHAY